MFWGFYRGSKTQRFGQLTRARVRALTRVQPQFNHNSRATPATRIRPVSNPLDPLIDPRWPNPCWPIWLWPLLLFFTFFIRFSFFFLLFLFLYFLNCYLLIFLWKLQKKIKKIRTSINYCSELYFGTNCSDVRIIIANMLVSIMSKF